MSSRSAPEPTRVGRPPETGRTSAVRLASGRRNRRRYVDARPLAHSRYVLINVPLPLCCSYSSGEERCCRLTARDRQHPRWMSGWANALRETVRPNRRSSQQLQRRLRQRCPVARLRDLLRVGRRSSDRRSSGRRLTDRHREGRPGVDARRACSYRGDWRLPVVLGRGQFFQTSRRESLPRPVRRLLTVCR